jgi:TolB-like protein
VSVQASLPLSIIVLPFANLSNDPGQQYFTDAITDDLTSDLSRIAESFVIARNTAFAYKGKSVGAKQIGRELGVRYVLEGGVRRAEDQVQIDTQLVEVEDEKQLWAQRFETDRARLADARNEITLHLARTFGLAPREPPIPPVDRETAVVSNPMLEKPGEAMSHPAFLAELGHFHRPSGYCLAPLLGHSVGLAEHRPADGTIFWHLVKIFAF